MQEKFKLIFDYTIVLMYAFFFTGITLVGNIHEHIETINNIINENTASYPFFIESPTLLILAIRLIILNKISF